jgi:hypothetical protein
MIRATERYILENRLKCMLRLKIQFLMHASLQNQKLYGEVLCLQISELPDAATAGMAGPEIIPVFQNKSHDEINNDGRSECEKREVNEIHTDMGGTDSQFFSPPGAYPESMTLKPKTDFLNHGSIFSKITNF